MVTIYVNGIRLDSLRDTEMAFKWANPLFSFDNLQISRTQEFTLPRTPRNDNILGFAAEVQQYGQMMRQSVAAVVMCEAVQINGYLVISEVTAKGYKAVLTYGELSKLISELSPPETNATEQPLNYEERISTLRQCLEHYLDFRTDDDIPEQVVGAFVDKIVVHDSSFDWHLRYNGSGTAPQHTHIGAFTLHLDDAKAYLYAKSTKHRILKGRDLHVKVYL
ncbi:MAG: hypothetical protein II109_05980 [Paludibacteraceae bacterium]|nr:hypothetical protein [Paludibacteraceae bacterium]